MTDYASLAHRACRLAAIQNYLSSGTLFLHSLLDGHPEVLQIPGLAMRNFINIWDWAVRKQVTIDELVNALMRAFTLLFDGAHKSWRKNGLNMLGDSRDQTPSIDKADFRRHLLQLIAAGPQPLTRKLAYTYIHMAYYLTRDQPIPAQPLIVHPLHSMPASTAAAMLEDWPDARMVYMVRHPVSAFVSGVRHIESTVEINPVDSALRQLFLNFTVHGGNTEPFGDRPYLAASAEQCRCFRLEALHERPRETLEDVCAFLNIAWHDALLSSTYNGMAWWNRPDSPRLSGFDPKITVRGVATETTALDRYILRLVALPKLRLWKYDVSPGIEPLNRAIFVALMWVPLTLEWRFPGRIRRLKRGATFHFLSAAMKQWLARAAQEELIRINIVSDAAYDRPEKTADLLYLTEVNSETGLQFYKVAVSRAIMSGARGKHPLIRSMHDLLEQPSLGTLLARRLVDVLLGAAVWLSDYATIRSTIWRSYLTTRKDVPLFVKPYVRNSP